MGRPISLFSGYSQKENRITNYSLLVLKMLYEENPKFLAEALASIIGEDMSAHVGVTFHQQEKKSASVPDGVISQRSINMYIETKNWDWFYDDQLERHLSDLSQTDGLKVLIALGPFESDATDRFARIRSICDARFKQSIIFRSVTFEDFVKKVEVRGISKNLTDAIAEFRAFLDEQDLLPAWRRWLDVVNCAGIPEDITLGGVYMCPAEGGAYSHSRSRFFGMYRNKTVELVAEIEAVIDVDLAENTTLLKWKNTEGDDNSFKDRAVSKVRELRSDGGPTRVFVLGHQFATDFKKDTPGGMQASKRYFDVSRSGATTSAELADKLRGQIWSDWS